MTRTARGSRLYLIGVIVTILALAAIPMANVRALGQADPPTPAAPTQFRGERLELAWARERFVHDRMAVLFAHADQRIAEVQARIDRAKLHGEDVTAVQTALDAFTAAVKEARPIFESTAGIIAAHQGFDANGSVTDLSQAMATVQSMRAKLVEVRSTLSAPLKALRAAIQSYRQPHQPIPTPTS